MRLVKNSVQWFIVNPVKNSIGDRKRKRRKECEKAIFWGSL